MNYSVVALEREYAGGGKEIGEKLAKRLAIPCYSDEIYRTAANRIGASRLAAKNLDETAPKSLLYSLYAMSSATPFRVGEISPENALQQAENRVIKELAANPCVLIGHCAGAVLKSRPDVLRVFVHADVGFRRRRAIERYGVDPASVDAVLRKYDKRRANYYSFYSVQKWDDRSEYHILLDSGRLGVETCVDILETVVAGGVAESVR